MSIKVTLTEKEILETPNDSMLGELTRNKYWQARRDEEGPRYDDEDFGIVIGEDGLVKKIVPIAFILPVDGGMVLRV